MSLNSLLKYTPGKGKTHLAYLQPGKWNVYMCKCACTHNSTGTHKYTHGHTDTWRGQSGIQCDDEHDAGALDTTESTTQRAPHREQRVIKHCLGLFTAFLKLQTDKLSCETEST